MKIDLHIHTSTGSDGALPVEDVLAEAKKRGLEFISITDHDSLDAQEKAAGLSARLGIGYLSGIELNVTFPLPTGKSISLDFLGYDFDFHNRALEDKLKSLRDHRQWRAIEIMQRINDEFDKEGIRRLTMEDMETIRRSAEGALARPHIAAYLVKNGIVRNTQEAFDKYLVKCDVPKHPLSLAEASVLVRGACGVLILAHPNEPGGASLAMVTNDLEEQTRIIEADMLECINGVECWHQRHDATATAHYLNFAKRHGLMVAGGSDCHQNPILMGTVDVPDEVAAQFRR